MPEVRVEAVDLDRGTCMMYRDCGTVVRLAHDPAQMPEAAALALLCVQLPRLVGHMDVRRIKA